MEDTIKFRDVKYGRTSTDDQKANQTIENQKMELDKHGNVHTLNFIDEYWDDGESGSKPLNERPQGKRLLEDVRNKKFDRIWVCKVDRFGRDTLDSLIAIKELKKYGAELKSITEDTNDKMVLTILLAIAEKEKENILYRSMAGKMRIAKDGKWLGGLPPYGYIINSEKKLQLYDEKKLLGIYSEVDVIKRIYDLCTINKLSAEKISVILNKKGIPPYTEGKNKNLSKSRKRAVYWLGVRVRNLIKDEVFSGVKIFFKYSKDKSKAIPVEVPYIVTKEQWDKAQEVLKSNIIRSTRNAKRTYLLSGKITCGLCNRRYTGLLSHSTMYYLCSGHRFKGNDNPTKCKNKLLNASLIENQIWDDLKTFILQPEIIKNFLEQKKQELKPEDYKLKIKEIENRILNLEKKKQNYAIYLGMEDNPIIENIKIELEKIKNEGKRLKDEIKAYENLLSKEESEQDKLDEIELMLNKMTALIENPTPKQKKEIINILLDKVVVYVPDENTSKRKIDICYSFLKGGITKLTSIELL